MDFDERNIWVENEKLTDVTEASNVLLSVREKIKELEEKLSFEKKKERELSEKVIPDLLSIHGLSEVVTKDGAKIRISERYYGSITDENKEDCINWLTERKLDGIGKTTYVVHPSTLSAFVSEQIKLDPDFPKDLFKVHVKTRTYITNKK